MQLTSQQLPEDFQICLATENTKYTITFTLDMVKTIFNIPNSTTDELLDNLPMQIKQSLDSR